MEKEFEVQIRNYQMHAKSDLSFPEGITAIIGESEQGKSCILRAVETCLFNLIRPSHIKQGSTTCVIGIKYNGHTIIYRRDLNEASQTKYKIDGIPIAKIGRVQPQQIVDTLGFREIEIDDVKYRLNFMKQMRYPFLLDKTPSVLFKFIMSSEEEDRLLRVVENMRQDLKVVNLDITKLETERDVLKQNALELKEKYDKEEYKLAYIDKCLSYDAEYQKIENLRKLINNLKVSGKVLKDLQQRKLEVESKLSLINGIDELDVNKLINTYEFILSIKNKEKELKYFNVIKSVKEKQIEMLSSIPDFNNINNLNNLINNLHNIENNLNNLKNDGSKLKTFTSFVLPDIDSLVNLKTLITGTKDIVERVKVYKANKNTETTKLEDVNKKLSEFKICPYCGSNI